MIKNILGNFFLGNKEDKPVNNGGQNGQSSQRPSLKPMFFPKSIAVVGASSDDKKLGAIVLRNILDSNYNGELFPLNLKYSEIMGMKAYKDYGDLPVVPDLALIAIPAKFVNEVLEKIGQRGTKNVVIFSAGFKETGEEGKFLESQLAEIIIKYNINVLGPNCLGFVNNLCPLNATFGEPVNKGGNLRFVSQSGAIASSVFDWVNANGIGFSEFVTLGNKTDLNENDILRYFLENDIAPETREEGGSSVVPIGMYLESISNGKEFVHLSRKLCRRDPLFILKPGKSDEARQAMQSHTGSIAGEEYVLDVALEKAGVIRCEGIEDFADLSRVFAWEKLPKGRNVAIVSNAGGPAVLSSDFVAEEGLLLVRFDKKTRDELEKHLPRSASILNPVDVLGDALAERYEKAIQTLIIDEDVHALLIILTPQVMTQIEETAQVIGKLSLEYGKPIVCSFMGGSNVSKGERVLNSYRIPSFRYPERAVRAIAKMNKWREFKRKLQDEIDDGSVIGGEISTSHENVDPVITHALSENRENLDSFESNQILSSYGVKTPPTKKCFSLDDARSFVAEYSFPVVLKVSSPKLLHKTDEGGVVVNIDSDEKLSEGYEKMQSIVDRIGASELNTVQVQKQVNKGVEIIIGSKRDQIFGNVLMFGAGGVMANLIEDRNLGLVPLSTDEMISLIKGSKVSKMLEGYRGEDAYDFGQVIDLLTKLQNLLLANPQISELDMNPVIVNREGIWAVDGKIILG